MYYLYELQAARNAHQVHGGVLLDFGEMLVVCRFEDAVEIRGDELEDPQDFAQYWAAMGECGYDETAPHVQQVKARLLDREQRLLVEKTP